MRQYLVTSRKINEPGIITLVLLTNDRKSAFNLFNSFKKSGYDIFYSIEIHETEVISSSLD